MLTRDYITGFLASEIRSGATIEQARQNFVEWLFAQDSSMANETEKQAIADDINSYDVKS